MTIMSKPSTDDYRVGWDQAFGKRQVIALPDVPGSGPILSVVKFKGVMYAIRRGENGDGPFGYRAVNGEWERIPDFFIMLGAIKCR